MILVFLSLLLACGSPTAAGPDRTVDRVEEAFDVPPPPGMRTLQLFGVDAEGFELGEPVTVSRGGTIVLVGDLVLDVREPPSLVVYVPEARADAVLEAHTVELTVSPAH